MEMRIDRMRNHIEAMQELLNDWLHLHEQNRPVPADLVSTTEDAIKTAEALRYE